MVLQHETEIIVMVTGLVENQRSKCFKYFPDLNEELVTDNIKVKCTEQVEANIYVKKVLIVERVN
jgi:protein tyrosine phosphatase